MKETTQRWKTSAKKDRFEGTGFPEGHVKGEVKRLKRLELDPTQKEFFSNCPTGKIIVAEEIFSIDGHGFTFTGLFLSKGIIRNAPKAILLKKCNNEFLSGLVAAQSVEPSVKLPLFVWGLNDDLFEEIEENAVVTIRIEGKKAVVRILG